MDAIKPQADLIVQQRELEDEMTQMGIVTMQQKVKDAVENGVEDRTAFRDQPS